MYQVLIQLKEQPFDLYDCGIIGYHKNFREIFQRNFFN